ncbi:aminopeptidase N [Amycolatopsis jejuensis]|uniref:aminopeptidase N n=1 Tax=Amycolatopsis jejuensis TaxID=330084 RepID=UPI0005260693|nr:aminopeptidase N [Amycolatopsis jejuensis]
MAGSNISRGEARERAALLAVSDYEVHFDLTGAASGAATFRSASVIRFTSRKPGAGTHVDLTADRLVRATLNGEPLDPAELYDGHRLRLPSLAAENELEVVADCGYMRTGEGLHRFVDPEDQEPYLYTQFEAFDANRAFACFDQPDLKARFTFAVTGPDHWQVVSNTPAVVRPEADATARWQFEQTVVMPTYITALVAGPYHHVHDEHDGIPLGLYCRPSLADHLDADELFEITKQGFDFLHESLGYRYPFGKYDQLVVPEMYGGMENAGCVTLGEIVLYRSKVPESTRQRRAHVILHELTHMWFGDLVTMQWWDDVWLNESFATCYSAVALAENTRFRSAWTAFVTGTKTNAARQDQLPSTHPVTADMPDTDSIGVNLDAITYDKGAAVLKQLAAWVGREAFDAGLRTYFRKHEYANTTLPDLLDALEESSGRSLTSWSAEWLETPGINTLRPVFEIGGHGEFARFAIAQEASADQPRLRSHRVAVGLYDLRDGVLVRRDRIELDVAGARTEVPALTGVTAPDVVLVNDDDLTYAKLRFDPGSLAMVTEHLGAFPDSLPRALCWGALWDMTRDGELTARDYLQLVLRWIGTETEVSIVEPVLAQAFTAVHSYLAPDWQPTGLALYADAMHARLRELEPGSDLQLVFARAFIRSAHSEDHVALVRALLSGAEEIDGLAIETELRWMLLERLATLGAATEDEIAQEYAERDATAAGESQADLCRAARPTEAAKAEAWHRVMDDAEVPRATVVSLVQGFQRPGQLAVTEPYVTRYFDELGTIWAERSESVASSIVRMLYPSFAVDQRTVDQTAAYLEKEQPPAPLARLLREAQAEIERALNARAVDAAAAG